jgi:hypothetical protein
MKSTDTKEKLSGKKALFLLGVGLGYQVDAIRSRKESHTRLYAIEKHAEVFRKAAEKQNWEKEINSDVEFWIDEDLESVMAGLDRITADLEDDEWEIVTNRPSIRLDPEYYKTLIRQRRKVNRKR